MREHSHCLLHVFGHLKLRRGQFLPRHDRLQAEMDMLAVGWEQVTEEVFSSSVDPRVPGPWACV